MLDRRARLDASSPRSATVRSSPDKFAVAEAGAVIFIVVKFKTKPEWSDKWIDHVDSFTEATRAEPGNLWFDWSRSVDDPATFVLVEAFADDDAAGVHVNSDHFKAATVELPLALVETPKIINTTIEGVAQWSDLAEISVE
jgi:quinol monooxygenase YgiN